MFCDGNVLDEWIGSAAPGIVIENDGLGNGNVMGCWVWLLRGECGEWFVELCICWWV